MPYGLPWSDDFIHEISDKEIRDEFVADQIRLRIAMLIRALRDQPDRNWSQSKLGREMGKPQSVISRIEDPDYGKLSLQTLLDVAAAFDLALWVDILEWKDWFHQIKNVPNSKTCRQSFNPDRLTSQACEVLPPQMGIAQQVALAPSGVQLPNPQTGSHQQQEPPRIAA
jgi:hypothetical protein